MTRASLRDGLSPRAASMLVDTPLGAGGSPTRDAIVARLRKHGRPVFERVVDFEIAAAALAWPGHELGIIDYDPDPQTDDPLDPERTMVPIGATWNTDTFLFMGEEGEIVYYAGYVAMRNASIHTCLEQHAMREVRHFPSPWFSLRIAPSAIGPALAAALGLEPVPPASDAFEAWWASNDLELGHRPPGNDYQGASWLHARTFVALVGAMAAARRIDGAVRVAVVAVPTDTSAGLAQRALHGPPAELWGRVPGAVRFAHVENANNVVWVIDGARGLEVQQYFGGVWQTIGPCGAIRREAIVKTLVPKPSAERPPSADASIEVEPVGLASALSVRAQTFLREQMRPTGRTPGSPADRAGIAAKLGSFRYDAFDALIAFEILLSGREVDLLGRTMHFGIVYGFCRRGEPAPVELTGAFSMVPGGEILGDNSTAPFPRSASLSAFVEQLALLEEVTDGPPPAFTADVFDVDAVALASVLGLASVQEALAVARSIAPEVRFDLGCTLQKNESLARAAVPAPGAIVSGEQRYRHGSDTAYIHGDISVLLREGLRIEQWRALGGVVYGWDTLTVEGAVCRIVHDHP